MHVRKRILCSLELQKCFQMQVTFWFSFTSDLHTTAVGLESMKAQCPHGVHEENSQILTAT